MSEFIERLFSDPLRATRERAKDCAADREARAAERQAQAEESGEQPTSGLGRWELYVGTVQLFLVGPGSSQMFPASEAYYSGPVGTDEEREAARAAIRELNSMKLNKDMGRDAVLAVLAKHQRKGIAA